MVDAPFTPVNVKPFRPLAESQAAAKALVVWSVMSFDTACSPANEPVIVVVPGGGLGPVLGTLIVIAAPITALPFEATIVEETYFAAPFHLTVEVVLGRPAVARLEQLLLFVVPVAESLPLVTPEVPVQAKLPLNENATLVAVPPFINAGLIFALPDTVQSAVPDALTAGPRASATPLNAMTKTDPAAIDTNATLRNMITPARSSMTEHLLARLQR